MAIKTQLSPTATPGKPYVGFIAKAPTVPGGPHDGAFTDLSVLGTPGPRRSFVAKSAVVIKRIPSGGPSPPFFKADKERFERLRQDDEDILVIIANFIVRENAEII